VNLIFEDSQSDPAIAVSALQKLISTDKVSVVIGDIASSSVLAMAPIAEKAKVVLLSPGASNPDISQTGEYIFRNWQSDALEGEVDAKFAYEHLGYRNMAVLYVNNAYGTGLKTVFEASFQKLGGKILNSESFEQGAVDMRSQLNKIRKLKPDAIYMPGYPPEMAILLRQAKEMGIKIPFLSVQAFDDQKILETAKDAAEGVIFSVPKPPDTSNPVVSSFISKYKAKFNREPGVTSDTGYDALKIIVRAMNQAGTSAEQVRHQLLTLKDFPGAAGLTTFDKNGDVIKQFIFKQVKNGQFVVSKNGN
jgi:branched-chain amino acid transport system substrate-binding protein